MKTLSKIFWPIADGFLFMLGAGFALFLIVNVYSLMSG